jgi:hypothetical protein
MQPGASVRDNNKGIKALAQSVTPDFEFFERAKSPIELSYLFEEKGLDGN